MLRATPPCLFCFLDRSFTELFVGLRRDTSAPRQEYAAKFTNPVWKNKDDSWCCCSAAKREDDEVIKRMDTAATASGGTVASTESLVSLGGRVGGRVKTNTVVLVIAVFRSPIPLLNSTISQRLPSHSRLAPSDLNLQKYQQKKKKTSTFGCQEWVSNGHLT
ncbi:hypothetical protein AYI68_g3426 [Smittium mucronatum]|uniref:Uncharacterized protein n=1 Tax=Smittium mucronatum TaxID=133383 RepID=A0A1R0GZY4_9FUNG|nr:hypothetical protein AYI68_g3426 [Smittium mucronatum]